jgi:hypothetical protein
MRDYRSPFDVPPVNLSGRHGTWHERWARHREQYALTGDKRYLNEALRYVTSDCPPPARSEPVLSAVPPGCRPARRSTAGTVLLLLLLLWMAWFAWGVIFLLTGPGG